MPTVESACICTLRLGEKGGQDVCHKLVSSCSAYARGTVAPTEKSGQLDLWVCRSHPHHIVEQASTTLGALAKKES